MSGIIQSHRIVDNPAEASGQPVPTSSNLQEVTDNGNTTTNSIFVGGFLELDQGNGSGILFKNQPPDFSLLVQAQTPLDSDETILFPGESGTLALALVNVVSSDSNFILEASGYYTANGTTATTIIDPVLGNTSRRYILINMGSGDWTINASGGANEIFITNSLTNTFLIQPGESYIIYNNGLAWVVLT